MSERTKHLLSLVGVVLTIAAFYVRNAAAFPAVQGLLASHHVAAKRAIERIRKTGSIQRGDPDFAELAAYVEDRIAAQNPAAAPWTIALEKLEAKRAVGAPTALRVRGKSFHSR